MGFLRFVVVLSGTVACSDNAVPPPIEDTDGGPITAPDSSLPPCATPAPGCPCADAGAQSYCGVIYRKSGTYVSCSPGYLTCQDDGGWSACEGPTVYDGN
jgi:hypothetical protein